MKVNAFKAGGFLLILSFVAAMWVAWVDVAANERSWSRWADIPLNFWELIFIGAVSWLIALYDALAEGRN